VIKIHPVNCTKFSDMVLKIFKAVWFLSLLVVTAVFFYVYASLPERVMISETATPISVSREGLFYITLIVLSLINFIVLVFSKLYRQSSEELTTWFYGQIICLNVFFVIVLSFVSLLNSQEKFDYERLGVIIYGSVGLIVLWAASWPIYLVARKFLSKELV
jgi:hypothetical protein